MWEYAEADVWVCVGVFVRVCRCKWVWTGAHTQECFSMYMSTYVRMCLHAFLCVCVCVREFACLLGFACLQCVCVCVCV